MDGQQTTAEIDVVRDFLGALERLDVDAAAALLHPDVEYQNVPFPPARGLPAVRRQVGALGRYFGGFEVHHQNIASNGPVVLTERTDVLIAGPVRAAFWVCGTFEVQDGKIRIWRDRFDFFDVLRAFVWGGLQALLGAGSKR